MAAVRELIAEHRPYVRASLRHLGVSGDQLDDAEQDVFLVVVRRRNDFDPQRGTSYRGWMWGMCRNVAATYRRKTRRARLHDPSIDTAVRPPLEERVAAREVLSGLDESSRVLWLARCEGRSAQELADTLALPLTTIQWRLRQTRHAVRTALRGLARHAGAWIGWFVRPEQGLASLAIPALAVLVLAQPPSDPPIASDPPARHQAHPPMHATRTPLTAAPRTPPSGVRQQEVVPHVEEHEPTVRGVEPGSPKVRRRRHASGHVALGDPRVARPAR